MKTTHALLLATLLLVAVVFAQEGPPYPFNHPTNCISCHSDSTSTANSPALSGLTTSPAAGQCDPTQQECVWSHQVVTGVDVWKKCVNCHVAIANSLTSGPGQVHSNLYQSYGCACHAVAHVGAGDPTNGYVAYIYFYLPQAPTGYWDAKPTLTFVNAYIGFFGAPGVYPWQFKFYNVPTALQNIITQKGYIEAKALSVGYNKYPNGTVVAKSMAATFVEADFFKMLTNELFRYEYGTAYGAVLKNPNTRTHPLTEPNTEGATIVMGVFAAHEGSFILVVPYAPYSRAPYYLPAAVNPAVGACFNCHFIYKGQPGVAKVMDVGGVWKIGIPEDVLNTITDPHKIVLPQEAAVTQAAPNLALVALISVATLVAGGLIVARRRL